MKTKTIPISDHKPEEEAKALFKRMSIAMDNASLDAIEICLEQVIAHMYVTGSDRPPSELLEKYDEWVKTIRDVIERELSVKH
jgi:antitoxin component of RelBE/YafQ-DinJ toxin-antitoxin module